MKLILNDELRRHIIGAAEEETDFPFPRELSEFIDRADQKGWQLLVYNLIDCENWKRISTGGTLCFSSAADFHLLRRDIVGSRRQGSSA